MVFCVRMLCELKAEVFKLDILVFVKVSEVHDLQIQVAPRHVYELISG